MRTLLLAWLAAGLTCLLAMTSKAELRDASNPTIETVLIQGATFTMGTPLKKGDQEYHDDERPHTVTLHAYRIGKYPVTAEQMCVFLNSKAAAEHDVNTLYNHRQLNEWWPSTITQAPDGKYVPRKNSNNSPANQVTWKGAVLFCKWLSEQDGRQYRLPSEAEWELAARGSEGRKWPWGDATPNMKYGERYSLPLPQRKLLLGPVGGHPANGTKEGVFDFLAYENDEWCANKFILHPTAEQLVDTSVDLDDLKTKRAVRGYRARDYPRGPAILRGTEYGFGRHHGRPWTRAGSDELTKVIQPASHGLRVVEVVPETK